MAEQVLDVIARFAEGQPLASGLRIRFGWSMLTLVEDAEGLTVCEPDFDGDPLRAVRPTLDTTLAVIADQAAITRQLSVAPVDVSFDQFVVVARGALDAPVVQLYRDPDARHDDTGWSLTEYGANRGDDTSAYEAMRVYTFLRTRPGVIPVLVLPPRFAAIIDGNQVSRVLDDSGRELQT
jgi:hypothetical protein